MAINDPIADMLTRIRNAVRNEASSVNCLNSNVCRGIADTLKEEGYILGYELVQDGRQGVLKVKLKYGPNGEKLINVIKRESTSGRRVYKGVNDLPRPMDGMGISIVTTPKGVLSDRKCRELNVGGELLCTVS